MGVTPPGHDLSLSPHVVVLSAASPDQLDRSARRLRGHLARPGEPPALASVAFTTQTGRVAMACRLAVTCSNMAGLLAGLDAFLAGRPHPGVGTATVRTPAAEAGPVPATEAEAAAAWLAGRDVPWERCWPAAPARVSLPTYPFAEGSEAPAPPVRAGGDLEDYVKGLYAEVSGIPLPDLDARVPLERYGLSSLLVVRLNALLQRDLGDVSSTLFYEHPDLAGVASALAARTVPLPTLAPAPAPAARPAPPDGAVAIVGIAGRYPQAPDLERFWENLEQGRDCITPLPVERRRPGWPPDLMVGGFLDEVDRFDPLFFSISPRDADLMDPQERLFLEVAWETLEDAGYPRRRLRDRHDSRVGVFAGTMYNEYPFFGVERSLSGPRVHSGSSIAGIANRVSYFLDLHGPSMTVDTMCSASLTCVHLAVESLRRGECDLAIAGGVNLSLHPDKFVEQASLRMTSSDHRCRSFGAGGDGFAPGEGVGAVLLKPLAAALADGDRVHAVIRGTAVNHGGRTNGYMVPNPVAQGAMIREAIERAGVDPAELTYIEAHGTGTELGDPIEINGLERAFTGAALEPGACAIGSVKSSIGHLEGAAGIAGLTKVVLQLRHRRLAPSLHAERLNPNVAWDRSPFAVQREAAEWRGRRLAGVSSFGAGGGNAHVVVEEADPAERPARTAPVPPQLVVLSAADEDRLRAAAGRLAAFLRRGRQPDVAALLRELGRIAGGELPSGVASARDAAAHLAAAYTSETVDLQDVAFTLQVGREPLRERLAVVVSGVPELCERLEGFAEGRVEGVLRGRAAAAGAGPPAGLDLTALGRHWVAGGELDWARLHDAARPPRVVGLPSYPFARVRCWLPDAAEPEARPEVPLYRRTWVPAGPPTPAAPVDGAVLCLFRGGTVAMAEEIARGLDVELVREDALDDAWRLLDARPVAGWLDLCDLDRDEREPGPWTARLALLQAVVARRAGAALRVLHVTRGLQDVPGPPPSLAGARLAGFVRMLGAEHRRVAATVLDVDEREMAGAVLAEWRAADPYGEVCRREGRRLRPRLEPVEAAVAPLRPDPAAAYVITGGTRGLGAVVARHLVDRGARRLALLGRSEPAALVDELEARGARVLLHAGSLARRDELAAFLATVRRELGPIGGVVHCAGGLGADRRAFVQADLAAVERVLEPKTDGLEVLAELCEADRPAFFVLFSSISAVVPGLAAGVLDYSAANAFMNWFAGRERRRGRTAVRSICWPAWADGGGNPAAAAGVAALGEEDGLRVLERAVALRGEACVVPCPPLGADLDVEALLQVSRPAPPEPTPRPARTGGVARWLVELFSRSLRIPERDLDPLAEFGDLGVESVMLGELLRAIEDRTGRSLEPSLLLDHPTLARLSERLGEPAPPEPVPELAPAEPARPEPAPGDRIAVVGMACRFPGAPDVDSLWQALLGGRCAVGEVPGSRWDHRRLYRPTAEPGTSVSRWGGFVDGIEDFDASYFRLGDGEAAALDPVIRLVLECAAACFADAGLSEADLGGARVGVVVGGRASGYGRRAGTGAAALHSDQNFMAAHVAHRYDLRGPNLVVDSACSSGLVGVHLACRMLLAGDADLVLAAAAEVLLDAQPYLEFTAAGALSPTGRCRVFDERADGFVPGEGAGAVVLKPLAAALRDGDRVHAGIDAVAVNNDGRTMGMTTPNPAAQADVVRRALAAAGRSPAEVGMLEAHGTGTMIGDPIELRALTDAFGGMPSRPGACAIGSVKSNLGHLLGAAGMAGLLKTVLALEHGRIPPTLFCDRPNPRFDFASSPFSPAVELRDWPAGRPRVAGVSSFGLGGTNAHLVASALEPGARDGMPPPRAALPPPVFRRRRLWLEAVPPVRESPVAGDADGRLVTSILDLDFR
jgi:acyl transferase domain-containing protein/NAD(P)-dependent dehydrogenase (short-subunit alcohol dehydrogenase family)